MLLLTACSTFSDEIDNPAYSDSEMLRTPLTMEFLNDGTFRFINRVDGPVKYRINGGPFVTIDGRTSSGDVPVKASDVVTFYGDNDTYYNFENYSHSRLVATADFYLYGNIMSLIRSTGFEKLDKLEEQFTFYSFFDAAEVECRTHLLSHPTKELMLPATTLSSTCYCWMFGRNMRLTRAPKLPATKLASSCYAAMFSECASLETAPELPATELAEDCYSGMFRYCTKLKTAPVLPAARLERHCYSAMFHYCANLNSVICKATSGFHHITSPESYSNPFSAWLDYAGILSSDKYPVIYVDPSVRKYWDSFGRDVIVYAYKSTSTGAIAGTWHSGLTNIGSEDMSGTPLTLEFINDGTFSFKKVVSGPLYYSINGGAKVAVPQVGSADTPTSVPVSAGDKVAFYGDNASYSCSDDGQHYSPSAIDCTADCYVYGNIMSLIQSADFDKKFDLSEPYTFYALFSGNSHIRPHATRELKLPAMILTDHCYASMFYQCTSLTTAPSLPTSRLTPFCYDKMFAQCTSLTQAPSLSAQTLVDGCYNQMFSGCINLSSVICMACEGFDAAAPLGSWLVSAGTTSSTPQLYVDSAQTESAWENASFAVAPLALP